MRCGSQPVETDWTAFRLGLFTSLSNPKALLFFAGLFTALLPPTLPLWIRVASVGIIFLDSLGLHSALAWFFSTEGAQQAYTEYRGRGSIRKALAEKLAAFSGAPVDADIEIILTPGTQGALFLAMGVNIGRGDKVAIVEPDYFANRKLVEFFDGEVLQRFVKLSHYRNMGPKHSFQKHVLNPRGHFFFGRTHKLPVVNRFRGRDALNRIKRGGQSRPLVGNAALCREGPT